MLELIVRKLKYTSIGSNLFKYMVEGSRKKSYNFSGPVVLIHDYIRKINLPFNPVLINQDGRNYDCSEINLDFMIDITIPNV